MLADVELAKSYRLLNHGPTVLVSSAAAGRRNVMAAAWAMPLDFDPPKVLVVIDKSTYTRELVEASGEFVLNIPCRAQAEQVVRVGSESGHGRDKFASSGLEPLPARKVGAPRVAGCIAYLECKVVLEPHNQRQYDLFIGEVVAAQADDALFSDGHWHFDDDPAKRSLHYIAGGAFFATGEAFSV
ncbi:FMN reductase RutF, DIM6/NTAB family [Chromobacterium violaceum]|uniref:Flavin reductase n=1 Tax=Chromobacterium violaceum TaxID=536 RepID=A0A202BDU4_CHRVL|nr:flavin reductase family protein [Chromobacterium violaceum]ATP29424.1 flavin reductase family protein [Chromobacterium violaceum]ATP33330.1 flavin reductase family protein [Chromobacterium violaceum]KJH68246.1 flavin reductase [Chromobacterium violaceum]MBA8736869.1 flavin reductase family protein [Chromobacterium violaceum]MBX9266708.1 flavin reductase family protein [Chromobacterium violaceum]